MKILFITHKYPPSVGGMEKQSYELINRMSQRHECIVLAHKGETSIVRFFYTLKSRVAAILNEYPDIEIIHLNDGLMAAFFWLLGVKRLGKKVYITFHGLDVVFPLGLYQRWLLPKLQRYNGFICVSHATYNECLHRGFDAAKLHIVNNGVDVVAPLTFDRKEQEVMAMKYQSLNIKPSDIVVVGVGRPVRRKGFSWFAANVLPLLPSHYKYLHVGQIGASSFSMQRFLPQGILKMWHLFMGSTNDGQNLFDLSQSKEYRGRVILTGRISDGLKNYIISKAALAIMPNIKDAGDMEGFGLVALEVSIQGKTILASGIEGITDAIHDGKNGYLLPNEDPQAWADAIILHSQKAKPYTESIRQYTIDHFSWDKMIDGYEVVFAK
jgi:glycosyltransferase involved in cell wall biosynthesis